MASIASLMRRLNPESSLSRCSIEKACRLAGYGWRKAATGVGAPNSIDEGRPANRKDTFVPGPKPSRNQFPRNHAIGPPVRYRKHAD